MNTAITQSARAEHVNRSTGLSKVQQYGWKPVGPKGKLTVLHKAIISIDPTYQRESVQAKILAIAREWCWPACGAIIVAYRKDIDAYFAMDGQHRVAAAMKRSDVELLPCIVFEVESIQEEAEIFLKVNVGRKPLTAFDRYRALVVSNDPVASVVEELLVQSGRTANANGGATSVRCLSAISRHAAANQEQLRRLWPLICAVCEGQPLHQQILDGLMHIEKNLSEGQSLSHKHWSDRVRQVGYSELLSHAQRAVVLEGKGGAKVWAQGMMIAINKGRKVNRLLQRNQEPDQS